MPIRSLTVTAVIGPIRAVTWYSTVIQYIPLLLQEGFRWASINEFNVELHSSWQILSFLSSVYSGAYSVDGMAWVCRISKVYHQLSYYNRLISSYWYEPSILLSSVLEMLPFLHPTLSFLVCPSINPKSRIRFLEGFSFVMDCKGKARRMKFQTALFAWLWLISPAWTAYGEYMRAYS